MRAGPVFRVVVITILSKDPIRRLTQETKDGRKRYFTDARPFTPMNFGMGLTTVRFLDYFAETALGIIAGTFIFTFLTGNPADIRATGNWEQLLSLKAFFSIALFAVSLLIPATVK